MSTSAGLEQARTEPTGKTDWPRSGVGIKWKMERLLVRLIACPRKMDQHATGLLRAGQLDHVQQNVLLKCDLNQEMDQCNEGFVTEPPMHF